MKVLSLGAMKNWDYLFSCLWIVRILVRVILQRQLSVCLLDFLGSGSFWNFQNLIEGIPRSTVEKEQRNINDKSRSVMLSKQHVGDLSYFLSDVDLAKSTDVHLYD